MLDIENIFVKPITQRRDLLAYAQIELKGGFFISGIKVVRDRKKPGRIHLSFPVKFDSNDVMHRYHYPNTQEMRDFLTETIEKEYKKQCGEDAIYEA